MILSMYGQAAIFLLTVVVGFFIGLFYDTFRIFRNAVRHAAFFVVLEDLIFWIVVTIVMFYYMLNFNSGEIRPFSIAGAFIGMSLYFATISRLVVAVGTKAAIYLLNILKIIFKAIFKAITTPFILLFRLLSIPAAWCAKFFKRVLIYLRNLLRNLLIKLLSRVKKVFKKLTTPKPVLPETLEESPKERVRTVVFSEAKVWRL